MMLAAAILMAGPSVHGSGQFVFSCGYNSEGQLGLGTYVSTSTPSPVPLDHVIAVSAGALHSVFLVDGGKVFACGGNTYGQLGTGTTTGSPTPVQIPLGNVEKISAGGCHTLFLLDNGDVYACGLNNHGQLGLGQGAQALVPTKIPGVSGAIQISAGYYHSLVLLADLTVLAFGSNDMGQLGIGDLSFPFVYDPCLIPGIPRVTAISAGGKHSLFLTDTQTIFACGANDHGELGLAAPYNAMPRVATPVEIPNPCNGAMRASALATGFSHSMVLNQSTVANPCNKIHSFGLNCFGQLGIGNTNPQPAPAFVGGASTPAIASAIAAGGAHSFYIAGGLVYGFGSNAYGQLGWPGPSYQATPQEVPNVPNILTISGGGYHTLFLIGIK
jgi:alpha-tubulin suppressor-like RCC1 family protein